MKLNSQLSVVLHVLCHLSQARTALTSEQLAERMQSDASVLRRTLAGLREKSYVKAIKGHGGGWQIAIELSELTFLDIYDAVGRPPIFAIGVRDENSKCLVERAINGALDGTLREAEGLLLERFKSIKISELMNSFDRMFDEHRKTEIQCSA